MQQCLSEDFLTDSVAVPKQLTASPSVYLHNRSQSLNCLEDFAKGISFPLGFCFLSLVLGTDGEKSASATDFLKVSTES